MSSCASASLSIAVDGSRRARKQASHGRKINRACRRETNRSRSAWSFTAARHTLRIERDLARCSARACGGHEVIAYVLCNAFLKREPTASALNNFDERAEPYQRLAWRVRNMRDALSQREMVRAYDNHRHIADGDHGFLVVVAPRAHIHGQLRPRIERITREELIEERIRHAFGRATQLPLAFEIEADGRKEIGNCCLSFLAIRLPLAVDRGRANLFHTDFLLPPDSDVKRRNVLQLCPITRQQEKTMSISKTLSSDIAGSISGFDVRTESVSPRSTALPSDRRFVQAMAGAVSSAANIALEAAESVAPSLASSIRGARQGLTEMSETTGTASGSEIGVGGSGSSASGVADRNLYYIQLQEQIQEESRRFSTISNVLKARHDTAKNSIGNLRA